jgi:release factor glutamine methyltransferase
LHTSVRWLHGSWWHAVPGERFDLVLSNPPYIADDDPHMAALRHEPRSALTSGADGLDDIRAIVAGAPAHLRPGGWLLLEHGHDQAGAVRALLQAQGFAAVDSRRDLAGIDRCSGGRWGTAR